MERFFDFFGTASAARILIFCGTILIALVLFLTWAAETRETIKLWPPEISAPESERLQACKTMQTALHDQIEALENDASSAYKARENDQKALTEETALQVDAKKRDDDYPSSRSNTYEAVVGSRVGQLNDDVTFQDKVISWARQEIANRYQGLASLCGAIIEVGR